MTTTVYNIASKPWAFMVGLLLACLPMQSLAQSNCEDATEVIRLAERDLANRSYERAINRLLDARDICPAKKEQVNRLVKKAFQQIEGEKRSAQQARINTEQGKVLALAARKKADSSLNVANRVLDQLYFFEDRFGLTVKNVAEKYNAPLYRYGYINRKGKTVIPFEYEEATPFSLEDGFARVSFKGKKYLLDTLGQRYRLAERLSELGPETKALDLQANPLASLPDSLAQFKELQILLLAVKKTIYDAPDSKPKPKLQAFPSVVTQLVNLKYLDLSHQAISSLPPEIGQLEELETLLLKDNQLTALPASVDRLQKLETLNLEKNQLSAFPASLTQLGNLRDLNLSNNKLSSLPESIGELKQLRSLNLLINQLSSLPESIGQLAQLERLVLSHNLIQTLPEGLGKLVRLQKLVLSYNQLSRLPESIGRLSRLEELFLDDNGIEYLPSNFGQLKQLRILSANVNALTELPSSMAELQQLEALYLTDNQLSILPEAILQLSNLDKLFLSKNVLQLLPEDFGKLRQLETLFLIGNQIESLPASFFRLEKLRSVNLEGNKIKTLDDGFTHLSKLQYLNLNRNQLETLPVSIGQLESLEGLYLRENQLSSLPTSMGQLKSLKDIGLESNQLTTVPQSLCQISGLRVALDLHDFEYPDYTMDFSDTGNSILKGNPIESLPACYLEKHDEKQLVGYVNHCIEAERFKIALQTVQQLKRRYPKGFEEAKAGFYEKLAVVLTYTAPSEARDQLQQILAQ